MPHNPTTIYIAIAAGIVVLGGLLFAAISYIRVINALYVIIREEKPNVRSLYLSGDKPWPSDIVLGKSVPAYMNLYLMIGTMVLDLPNERYQCLLRTARKWLIVCLFLFMADVFTIGWLFQNSKWPL